MKKQPIEHVDCAHCCSSAAKSCIDRVPIFQGLPTEQKADIMRTATNRTYRKGEIIFNQGDTSSNLWIVHLGELKVSRLSANGKEQILRLLGPGEFVGEFSLFHETIMNSTAEALVETEICMVNGNHIKQILQKTPEIAIQVLEMYAERLQNAENMIEQLGLYDVEQRIARFLLDQLHQNYGDEPNKTYSLTLPMSKGDLSSLLGITQETLSRRLTAFQTNGWIQLEGQRGIRIMSKNDLEELLA